MHKILQEDPAATPLWTSSLGPNVVLLDAGDAIFWSDADYDQTTFVANTMNLLQYDTIALGNHELDTGSVKLEKFVDLVNFPVLATNVKGFSNPDGKMIDLDSDEYRLELMKLSVSSVSRLMNPIPWQAPVSKVRLKLTLCRKCYEN
jgi:hypothetical protein